MEYNIRLACRDGAPYARYAPQITFYQPDLLSQVQPQHVLGHLAICPAAYKAADLGTLVDKQFSHPRTNKSANPCY
ncbi:Uncharacterised protein [uncultured archaeon]|nr:Uncharacterised protein [uncultured archaeon]